MRRIFKDDALQCTFLEPGYVKVPMLSSAEVAGIREALGHMRPDDAFVPKGRRTFTAPISTRTRTIGAASVNCFSRRSRLTSPNISRITCS